MELNFPSATRSVLLLLSVVIFLQPILAQQETIGAGNLTDVVITSSHQNGSSVAQTTLDGNGLLPNLNASSRFLAQATLGADYETIQATAEKGFTNWLDEQCSLPVSFSLKQHVESLLQRHRDSLSARGLDPSSAGYYSSYWRFAWWQYVMTSPDVLRSRIALALSEIFVVSEIPQLGNRPLGLASYYDMLIKHSLGNFRSLLYDVTLHPCMGVYLTHLNNPKADWERNTFPDENYAREVMQLFTIGLYELNLDGTPKTDAKGEFIPAYSHDDISQFAKVFTGLSWVDSEQFGRGSLTNESYAQPMKMYDAYHEPGAKWLLNDFVVPNRNPPSGMADINDAVDNLFQHPNVGPFIAHRLIQRLVTSNPSPEYIKRVATKFNNNGQGVRGDMKAVVKAILLDPEARNCALQNAPTHGMLREPIVRYTQISRAFNAASEEGDYRNRMDNFYEATAQRPLASPSVFNFFQPDYQPIGPIEEAGLVAPEFQITNALTAVGYANQVHEWIMNENPMQYGSIFSGEAYYDEKKTKLNLDDEYALVMEGKLDELVERLNLILVHGRMSERTRNIILNAISQVPEAQLDIRLKLAVFLVMVSPEYLVLK